MEKEKGAVGELVDDIKEYLETTSELYKLQAAEKTATVASSLTIYLMIALAGAFVVFFISLAAAVAISSILNNPYSGFLILAGVYLVLFLIVYSNRDKWLKSRLTDSFIKAMFTK